MICIVNDQCALQLISPSPLFPKVIGGIWDVSKEEVGKRWAMPTLRYFSPETRNLKRFIGFPTLDPAFP